MNPQIKAQWVAALRSGEYKQGYKQLRYVDRDGHTRYCCLGVLCDLYSKETGTPWDMNRFLGDGAAPGRLVALWADTLQRDPYVEFEGVSWNLARVNDTQTVPFTVIADLIEQQL